jgi:DNA-binding MarR family transcriptional regulator
MIDAGENHDLATDLWRRFFQFFISTRWQRDAVLQRLGLTPNDAKALNTLDATEGKPMRALADEWGTDASAATWVIDRLERKGLAERRSVAHDRRVKAVFLTPRGLAVREEILRAFYAPPPEFLALDRKELDALGAVLRKLEEVARNAPPPSDNWQAPAAVQSGKPKKGRTG